MFWTLSDYPHFLLNCSNFLDVFTFSILSHLYLLPLQKNLIYIKVKLSLYRVLGLQEVEVPRIFRKSTHEGGMVFRPTHWPPLPPKR